MTNSRRSKLLLLDLYANRDGFAIDEAMGKTAARLRELGHDAFWVQSIRDGSAKEHDSSAAWLSRISAEVSQYEVDFVVLARAWNYDIIQAIRQAMRPNSKLVRLTSGVAAALDSAFDYVVDERALYELAAGHEPNAGPLWQPKRATELRRLVRLDEPALRVNPIDIDKSFSSPRPTISGPASGCPFLLDTRRNHLFDRANLDGSKIQTRGCSFCLDNHGAYVVPSDGDVLESWLRQWRRIRQSRADVREVLLTDERPHPWLPAFFAAIEGENGLGGIELMIKSRVDWLLEFSESHIVPALRSAQRTGSILHIYLVGFESFDAFHLDLFNKGATVDDNVRAIELLRELERRFPDSFEYRKYRAHGIVVFTPWTTPESLLENARWMREVRFHELRTESLRTRLRLYPRTPLHALAAADGLLAEDFGARGDRAIEQGYDASVPWRFRDPRVAAIECMVTELNRINRSVRDDQLLEFATHIILRWPELSQLPNDAWKYVCHAIGTFPAFDESELGILGPIASAFDPEMEAVLLGIKRASLKENVATEGADLLMAAYRAMGLAAGVVDHHALDISSGTHSEGRQFAIVAIAANEPDLKEVLELQRAHASGKRAPISSMGAWMGYPACCVAAFEAQDEHSDNLENERATMLRAPDEPLDPLLNRLGRARLISHHLCRPSCAASRTYAEKILGHLEKLEMASADWIRQHLARAVLAIDYDHRLELSGEWCGETYHVQRATVILKQRQQKELSFDFDPQDIAKISLRPDMVRFELRHGRIREFPANRPLLVVPNQPLAPAALAAIAPRHRGAQGASKKPSLLDRLPNILRIGASVRTYRIADLRTQADHHEVVLANGRDRFVLELRMTADSTGKMLRAGPWAIGVDHPERLSEDARAAIAVFVRALVVTARKEQV